MKKVGEKISYDPSKKLGEGGFAIVYEGLFEGSKKVAVKRIQNDHVSHPLFTEEIKIMLDVSDHQNILRYICYDTDDYFLFIVTEFCAGNLNEWVEGTYKGPEIGMNERKMLHQVTKGLAYLHSKNIIHRDIKPTNILIFVPDTSGGLNEPQMKITDFGLSKVIQSEQADLSTKNKTNPRGTRGWIAPELYEEDRRYDFKVDIFPLGCLFGYTLSKEKHHPFGNDVERSFRIVKKLEPEFLTQNDMKEPYSKDCLALELIQTMIKMEPRDRPVAEEVLSHSFFINYGLTRPIDADIIINKNSMKLQALQYNANHDDVRNQPEIDEPSENKNHHQRSNSKVRIIDLSRNIVMSRPLLSVGVVVIVIGLLFADAHIRTKDLPLEVTSYASLLDKEVARFTEFAMGTCPRGNNDMSRYGRVGEIDEVGTKKLLELSSITSKFVDYQHSQFINLMNNPGVDVNATDSDGMNALLKLTRNYGHKGLIYFVTSLIERSIDVNATDPDGWNALHNLCGYYDQENLPELVLLLRDCNIDLEAKTKEGFTALSLAAFRRPTTMSWIVNGTVEILSKDGELLKLAKDRIKEYVQLITSRSKLTDQEIARFTQLVSDENVDLNSLIAQLRIFPRISDGYDHLGEDAFNALFRHYKHDNLVELARISMVKPVAVSAVDSMGKNILHYLFQHYEHDNLLELIQLLLDYKGSSNNYFRHQTKTGWSPLHVLFRYYRYDNLIAIVKLLIEKTEENFFATNVRGWTPLHHLCRYYNHDDLLDIFILLKEHGYSYSMSRQIENTTDGHSATYLLKTVFWNPPKNKNKIIEMLRKDNTEPTIFGNFYQ